jgi:hypothetical protein
MIEEELTRIRGSDEFKGDYETYCSDNSHIGELQEFVDGIQLNSKYFRLTMNTKSGGYRKKHKNRNLGEDTVAIKEVTSYLNKLTDRNYPKINAEIKKRLEGKDYLKGLIMDSIIDKCLIYTIYIPIYLVLIQDLYGSDPKWTQTLETHIEASYKSFTEVPVNSEESDYLQFCAKNKILDKMIGHSLLLTECEKTKLIVGKIHPNLDTMLQVLKDNADDSERYKCVQCLYGILKSLYGDSLLPEGYRVKIDSLIHTEASMKIKFKMMDIIDRR